jgi:energy-coupling factor transport system ATP-binding protein
MITLDHVTYSYPGATRPTIHDLSLTICEGEFLLVCGPSGAGKSTLLRLMNGLVPHFHGGSIAGEVRVWGRSTRIHEPRDLADVVGFVFQDPEAQLVVDVVEDEIVFAMENLGLPQKLMRRRVEEVLDQLGIAHLRRRQVASLSGGERQRVAIASALAAQPRALVLDEPTSQLDPHAAEEVLTALQKLNADLGLTIVLSEHRLERVVQYADRMLYLPRNADQRPKTKDQGDVSNRSEPSSAFGPSSFVLGPPREVLSQVDLAPPLVALAKVRGWSPLPLTIKEARLHVRAERASERGGEGVNASAVAPSAARPVASSPSLVVERVHFSYGEHEALYDLSLSVRPGEVLALMGRNGSGKTTLLKLLVGLLKAQHGKVTVLGQDVARRDVEDMAAFVGYVPQDPRSLLFHVTVREELEFTLRGRKTGDERRRTKGPTDEKTKGVFGLPSPVIGHPSSIDATLDRLGIAHLAAAYPRDLSGGEAQRAAMAAILVAGPPALLLDEPTRGLDYAAKAGLGQLLRRLAAEGRTVVMSTQDVELVAAYADRVALLSDGELVVEGPVRDVLSDSLIFSSQVAKLFPGTGWLTVEDTLR